MVVSGDGWQGPVSIGIFLGLHALLKDFPGKSGGGWVGSMVSHSQLRAANVLLLGESL